MSLQPFLNTPQPADDARYVTVNLGPTHPATHGILQSVITLDGEHVVDAEQTVGYIHRAFEKLAERRPFYQITPITDRLNYCSSPINNMGWHMTVEKLLNVKTPKRVDYMRVIIMELARIADHLICNSVLGVDSGAFLAFCICFNSAKPFMKFTKKSVGRDSPPISAESAVSSGTLARRPF